MARNRPSPGERAHCANVSDVYLTFSCLCFFGGTFGVVNGVDWMTTIALWLIALYLFVASVVWWSRRS
jgi:hypothetical protein